MIEDPDDDTTLVARCRGGEQAAWEALVHRYKRLVFAIARRGGLDEHLAADVFQTVFSRLFSHLNRIGDPTRLRAWIVTTTKREVWLEVGRSRREVPLPSGDEGEDHEHGGARQAGAADIADPAGTPEQWLEELEQVHVVRLALERLDARCRDLLLLVFADDDERLPYEEIARRMSMPVGSIGPTRSRCLGKLRQFLG